MMNYTYTRTCENCGSVFELQSFIPDYIKIKKCSLCKEEKSAFQEWDDKEPVDPNPIHNDNWHRRRGRKEGWNAAIDAVLNIKITACGDVYPSPNNFVLSEQVEELKEP